MYNWRQSRPDSCNNRYVFNCVVAQESIFQPCGSRDQRLRQIKVNSKIYYRVEPEGSIIRGNYFGHKETRTVTYSMEWLGKTPYSCTLRSCLVTLPLMKGDIAISRWKFEPIGLNMLGNHCPVSASLEFAPTNFWPMRMRLGSGHAVIFVDTEVDRRLSVIMRLWRCLRREVNTTKYTFPIK